MKTPALFALLCAATVTLSGCSGNHVTYGKQCMTCVNNPVTGEPINYDPTQYSTDVVANNGPYNPGRAVPHTLAREQIVVGFAPDVDSTAMRLKKAFGYLSKEEAIASMGNAGKMMFAGPGYAYEASPGAFYFMKTQAYSGELSTEVSRNGNGSRVVITYEQKRSGGKDVQTVMREVRERAEKAMQ